MRKKYTVEHAEKGLVPDEVFDADKQTNKRTEYGLGFMIQNPDPEKHPIKEYLVIDILAESPEEAEGIADWIVEGKKDWEVHSISYENIYQLSTDKKETK